MNAFLTFDDVSFSFAQGKVLDRASFSLAQGSCTALIGPNGGGKTTLLRIAAGLLTPASGRVLLGNHPLASMRRREIAHEVALVPQQLEVPFSFTVEQIVEQGRTPYLSLFGGLQMRDRQAIERAMELTDVTPLRHRVYNELSGGERQRVKIALGLAQEPRLLLLDEPTQNLDFGRQMDLINLIRSLHAEGIYIFAAMHDLTLIPGTFSSVVLISPLERLRQGSPEEILKPGLLERAFRCPPPRPSTLQQGVPTPGEFAL
jgi:iron complex transport system ATP-binding protein